MKTIRWIVAGIAAVVLLIAALAAYVAVTFDAPRIKQEASKLVLDKTGRTLTIDGNVHLKFWPNLGVEAEQVSLSEYNSKTLFASLAAAHASLQVMPLLEKKFVADTLEVDGLHLTVIRDRKGHLNIDDLLGKNDDPSKPPPDFDVAGVRIIDAELIWRDELKSSTAKISSLDLTTGHVANSKDGLKLQAIKLSIKGKLNGDNIEFAADLPSLSRKGEQIGVPTAKLQARLDGQARRATIQLGISGIEGTSQALKIGGLTLDVDATLGDKRLKGNFKTPIALDIPASNLTLSELTGTLDLDMPGLPAHPLKLPISGHLKADYAKPSVSGSLATTFDESHIESRFNVVGSNPPNIGLELDIDRLNVDKYLPPAKAEATSTGDEKIDLSALKSINASGVLRVGDLQVKNIKARNVRVSFKAAKGNVSVAPHSADLYGGHVNGAVSLAANGNHIALNESLSAIDVKPLLQDVAGKDIVEGKGDVTLDIATAGDTVTALKKSLSGSARAVLKDGAIKGINIAQALRNAKTKLSGGSAHQEAAATDKTDFSELSASFKIINGVAHNDDLAAKSPFLRLGGAGDIDIGNSQINYVLKASVVSSAAGQGGKEADSLKGLTLPVHVSGPLEKPAFKLDMASMISDSVSNAAKAHIEDKKQEVKKQLENNVKDKLKGLFQK